MWVSLTEIIFHADPSYALAYTTMGAALNHAQKYQEASRTLLRAVSLQPSAWQAYYELAKASLGQGDYKTAQEVLQLVIKAHDDYLGDLPGIAGGTVLGNGRISHILDIASLIGHG